jgi:hypothetical protein
VKKIRPTGGKVVFQCNGWKIKIGRGLDFYQKPGGWFEIGSNNLSMHKCLETKVDISMIKMGY